MAFHELVKAVVQDLGKRGCLAFFSSHDASPFPVEFHGFALDQFPQLAHSQLVDCFAGCFNGNVKLVLKVAIAFAHFGYFVERDKQPFAPVHDAGR